MTTTRCILGLITARGGSKGLPRKNILPLAGKPLIAWTLEAARRSRRVDRVVVSTDDQEIASVSRQWGAEVPFIRPAELARDESGHMDVVIHAVDWLAREQHYCPDYVLLLQPTSPLRSTEDIDAAVDLILARGADSLIGICEVQQHPYLVRKITEEGRLADFMADVPPPGSTERRRQNWPPAYVENGAIYLTRTTVLLERRTFLPEKTIPYIMPMQRSLEIDNAWDMRLVEAVISSAQADDPITRGRL